MTTTEVGRGTGERAASRARRLARVQTGDALFAAGLASLLGWAAWCGRGLWFFFDEWKVITHYHDGHWLEPFNGHLSLVPIAVYRVGLSTLGYATAPYRVFALLCYAAVAVVVFLFARTRVDPVVAATAALLVAWSSQAQLMIMFPLLFNFSIPVAATVAVWMLLERDRPGSDVAASVVLAIALATSAVGLITAAAAGAELVVHRETRLRRWLTLAPPMVLWTVWYFAFGEGNTGAGGDFGSVASFAARQFWATFVGLGAGSKIGGVAVLAVAVLVVGAAVARWRTFDRRAAVIALTFLAFLAITAVGRNAMGEQFGLPTIPPETDRYAWVDGLLVVCLLVQCLRACRLPTVAVAAALVLVAANAAALAPDLPDYRTTVRSSERSVRTVLVATDALGERADQSRDLPLGFLVVPTADYLGFARHFGSPVAGVSDAALGDEQTRRVSDRWMLEDLDLHLAGETASDCRPLSGASSSGGAIVRAPATVLVRAGETMAEVHVRRLARAFGAPALGEVPAGTAAVIRFPADHSERPWFVRASGSGATAAECG